MFEFASLHLVGVGVDHVVHTEQMQNPVNDEKCKFIVDRTIMELAGVFGCVASSVRRTNQDVTEQKRRVIKISTVVIPKAVVFDSSIETDLVTDWHAVFVEVVRTAATGHGGFLVNGERENIGWPGFSHEPFVQLSNRCFVHKHERHFDAVREP